MANKNSTCRNRFMAILCFALASSCVPVFAADPAAVPPEALPDAVKQVIAAKYRGWTVDHARLFGSAGENQ